MEIDGLGSRMFDVWYSAHATVQGTLSVDLGRPGKATVLQ